MLFINPDNPSGKVYSPKEVEALAQVIIKYNEERKSRGIAPLIVLSDEASRRVVFDDKKIGHIGAVAGMEDYVITVTSLSKTLGPGIAAAYTVMPEDIFYKMTNFAEHVLVTDAGPDSMARQILAGVLKTNEFGGFWEDFFYHIEMSVKQFEENRKLVLQLVDDLNQNMKKVFSGEGFAEILLEPEGGLCCMIKMSGFLDMKFPDDYVDQNNVAGGVIDSDLALAEYLEKVVNVGLLPGSFCGIDPKQMTFRITMSKDREVLKECFELMAKALSDLKPAMEKPLPAPVVVNVEAITSSVNSKLGL